MLWPLSQTLDTDGVPAPGRQFQPSLIFVWLDYELIMGGEPERYLQTLEQAGVSVPSRPFQPSLIFSG